MEQLSQKAEIRKFVGVFMITAACFSILVFFQNCSEPTALEDNVEGSSVAAETAPFAFETKMDHIAHMSCSGVGDVYSKRSFFTFRVGAYKNGSGIGLTPEFQSAIQKLPRRLQMDKIRNVKQNQAALLQLSTKILNDYGRSFVSFNSIAEEGRDYDTALGPLDTDILMQYILNLYPGEKLRHTRFTKGLDNRLVEMDISLSAKNALSQDAMRSNFENNGRNTVLFVGYSGSRQDPKVVKKPNETSTEFAYGKAYKLSFGHGHKLFNTSQIYQTRNNQSAYNRLVLSGVTEYDGATGRAVSARWDCPSSQVYMVVRQSDIDNKVDGAEACNTAAEGVSSSQFYSAMRNVLRVEDWSMDQQRRCIVNRQAGDLCYEGQTYDPNTIINYNGTYADGKCGPNVRESLDLDNDGRNESVRILCPAYVSVCRRL